MSHWWIAEGGCTDTYVDSSLPTTNFEGGYDVFAGQGNGTAGPARIWLKISTGGIPKHSKILTAQITMHTYIKGESGYGTTAYEIQRCTDISWNSSTITWNNAPNASMTGSATTLFSQASPMGQDLYFDFVNDAQANVGLDYLTYRIKNVNETDDSMIKMYTYEEYNDIAALGTEGIRVVLSWEYEDNTYYQAFS